MNIGALTAKVATVGGPKVQLAAAKVAKYSPQILTAVGIVGGIASTVMIARATLKVEALVENHEMGRRVIADKTVVALAPVEELEHSEHPWIKEYFLGPRGRAAGGKRASAQTTATRTS